MWRPSFSLRALLMAMAVISVACATLRFPAPWLVSAWWLATVGALLLSVVAAAVTRPPRRAFWLGVAILGWGYFLLTLFPVRPFPGVASRLATTQAVLTLYWALNPDDGWSDGEFDSAWAPPQDAASFGGDVVAAPLDTGDSAEQPDFDALIDLILETTRFDAEPSREFEGNLTFSSVQTPVESPPSLEEFVRLGHLLWTLLFAFCGGVVGRRLYGARENWTAA